MPLLDPDKGPILVTGAAGFIGATVCHSLLEKGCKVVGVDNLNDYTMWRLNITGWKPSTSTRIFSFSNWSWLTKLP